MVERLIDMVIKLPKNPCAICRQREATQLCDFVVDYYWMSHVGRMYSTCDLPMCKECAKEFGSFDFCPYHSDLINKVKITDEKLQKRIIRDQARRIMEAEERGV